MDYKKSGVDIEAGYKSVELMKEAVKSTMREEVLGGIGGFSGAFSLAKIKEMEEPVLLSGTDGCGTKVKLAFIMDKHDTIGIDAVAMLTMLYVLVESHSSSLITSHAARIIQKRLLLSLVALQRAADSLNVHLSVVRQQSIRDLCHRMNMTLQDLL